MYSSVVQPVAPEPNLAPWVKTFLYILYWAIFSSYRIWLLWIKPWTTLLYSMDIRVSMLKENRSNDNGQNKMQSRVLDIHIVKFKLLQLEVSSHPTLEKCDVWRFICSSLSLWYVCHLRLGLVLYLLWLYLCFGGEPPIEVSGDCRIRRLRHNCGEKAQLGYTNTLLNIGYLAVSKRNAILQDTEIEFAKSRKLTFIGKNYVAEMW